MKIAVFRILLDWMRRSERILTFQLLKETIASLKIGLAKYGHLDHSFRVAGSFDWGTPPKGIQDLKNLGFLNPEVLDDACIEILAEDLTQRETFVKLFLEEQPVRDFMTYWTGTLPDGRTRASLLSTPSMDFVDPLLKGYFPKTFTVTDACVTNAASVWFAKHFYL